MGLLQTIFGKTKDAASIDTIEAATAALARLNAEREAAEAVIAGAMQKRRDLLLIDGSDKQIAALDCEVDAARLAIDRCDAAAPSILARIQQLQTADRRALLATLEANLRVAEKALDAALAATLDPLDDYLEAVRQLDVAGFERESAGLVVRPPLIGEGVLAGRMALENWRRSLEALRDARATAARPHVPAPAPIAKVVPLRPAPAPEPYVSYRKQEPAKISEPVAPGFTRLEAIMNNVDGSELGVNRMLVRGDQIDLPAGVAARVLRGSAFSYVCGDSEELEGAAE